MSARGQREFFAVRTLGEALTGFRPSRRTGSERVPLDAAVGRVPAEPVSAPHALPGFARATVDGFAVRASDTYGASEGLPTYLDIVGEARMGRPPEVEVGPGTAVPIATGAPLPPVAGSVPAAAESPVLEPANEDVDLAIVKSPIVGTFYRAAEPDAPPFVEAGQFVKKGQVLCIIEAMKLMNEINAECDGEVVRIYVENGQAVQYGERLFAIKPA